MADSTYLPDERPGLSKYLEKQRINADPVGPTAPAVAPGPSKAPEFAGGRTNVAVDPTLSDAARDPGMLRPKEGPFSPSNLDPNNPPRPSPVLATAYAPSAATPTPTAGATPATAAARTPASLVTAASPAATAPDRPLPGAVVNGVRVFSDGTGGANAPAATVDSAALADIAKGRSLTRADAGPGGAIGSEAFGGTPELGAFTGGVGVPRPQPQGNTFARDQAAIADATRNAQSDLASIATRDFRSVLGSAARNADVERNSRGSAGERDHASALSGLTGAAVAGLKPTADLAGEDIRDSGATSRANTEAAASIERAAIEKRPGFRDVNLADGTMGVLGPDGVMRPAVDASGKPVRPQVGKPALDTAAYGKSLEGNLNKLLGVDANGQIPDPDNPGKSRTPSAAELYRASIQARKLTNEQYGVAEAPGAARPQAQNSDDGGGPIEGEVRQDASGNRARWVNGKWQPVA